MFLMMWQIQKKKDRKVNEHAGSAKEWIVLENNTMHNVLMYVQTVIIGLVQVGIADILKGSAQQKLHQQRILNYYTCQLHAFPPWKLMVLIFSECKYLY